MVKVNAFDVSPPEFWTLTVAEPDAAIRLAGTAAVSWLALTKVVVSGVPFHRTPAPLTKPEPLAVRVNDAPPAVAVLGARLVRIGGEIVVGQALLSVR